MQSEQKLIRKSRGNADQPVPTPREPIPKSPAQPDQRKPVAARTSSQIRAPSTAHHDNNTTSLPTRSPDRRASASTKPQHLDASVTPNATLIRDLPDHLRRTKRGQIPDVSDDHQSPKPIAAVHSQDLLNQGTQQFGRARQEPGIHQGRAAQPATSDQLVQKRDAIADAGRSRGRPRTRDQSTRRLNADAPTVHPQRQLHQDTTIARTQIHQDVRPPDTNLRDQKIDYDRRSRAPRREAHRRIERVETTVADDAPSRNDKTRNVLTSRNGIHHPTPRERGSTALTRSSVLINQRQSNHRLGQNIARALRPPRRNRTLPLRSTPTSQSQAPRQVRARAVPPGPEVRDVVDQRGQPAAHRLAKRERLRDTKLGADSVKRERERSRDAKLQPNIVRLPRREELGKIPGDRGTAQAVRRIPTTSTQGRPSKQSKKSEEKTRTRSVQVGPGRSRNTTVRREELRENRHHQVVGLLRTDAENGRLRKRHRANLLHTEIGIPVQQHPAVLRQLHHRRRSRRCDPIRIRRRNPDSQPLITRELLLTPSTPSSNRPMSTLQGHPEKFTPRESRLLGKSSVLIDDRRRDERHHPDLPVTSHQYPPRSIPENSRCVGAMWTRRSTKPPR